MTDWALSIDVGTTATAAAIAVGGQRRSVELDGRSRMPSTVLAPEQGPIVVGEAADAQAAMHPDRVERTPKARLGDPVILLGDRAVEPVDAVAAILAHVAQAAAAQVDGSPPRELVLTHPAVWGAARLDLLRLAARRAGLPEPELVSEPLAAAALLASDLAAPGDLLAVYDLGGGTFDVAIVRRTHDGFEVAGPPGGAPLGGEALDDLVVDEVLRRLPPLVAQALSEAADRTWRQARAQLRKEARAAKEALSTADRHGWYLGAPIDVEVSLTVAELEGLIGGAVAATVRTLLEAVDRAGLTPRHLQAIVMVGGCARAPIVARTLEAATGRPPTTWGDPKAAVSLGALEVAATRPPEERVAARAPDQRAAPPEPPAADAAGHPSLTTQAAPVPPPEAAEAPQPPDPTPIVEVPAATAPPPGPGPAPEPRPAPRGPAPEGAAEPVAAPVDEPAASRWDRERVGAVVAIALVATGLLLALIAVLLV